VIEMVQVVHVTGIASAATTPISLGTYIGRGRVATLTATRQIINRTHALSLHALAAHSHAYSGHAHSHAFSGHAQAAPSGHAWNTGLALMLSNNLLFTSDGGTGFALPVVTGGINGVVNTGGINGVTGGTATARAQMGNTRTLYTIDSYGRYVAAGTHPAANHAVLKLHGAAGPRIELGNALQNTDILEIVYLEQALSGGVF
jgi:hypothetical protein